MTDTAQILERKTVLYVQQANVTYTCIVHFVPKPTVKLLWIGL